MRSVVAAILSSLLAGCMEPEPERPRVHRDRAEEGAAWHAAGPAPVEHHADAAASERHLVRPVDAPAGAPPVGEPGGDEEAPRAPAAAPGESDAPPATPAGPPGIEQVSATTWKIDRALVDRWTENPGRLGSVVEAGDGWRLRKLRVPAFALGMKNGDVIQRINGHGLANDVALLLAYAKLKNDTEFTVEFVRDGATLRHHYKIR